jgi:hypothetical protein
MPLDQPIRTERSHGLKAAPPEDEKQALYNLVNSAGWTALLNVLERCCIEQETRLINRDVEDDKGILAEHKMSKAYWQIFTRMQRDVLRAAAEFAGVEEEPRPRTEEEQILSVEGMQYASDLGE